MLAEICGFDAVTLQPAAGAHGELTGILIDPRVASRDAATRRAPRCSSPTRAHGTNPATARHGRVPGRHGPVRRARQRRSRALRAAGRPGHRRRMMITNPNTLGLWDEHIEEIVEIVHEAAGWSTTTARTSTRSWASSRPGDIGIDIMHFNLHKTFTTPHGGGGPGSGPVGVREDLAQFLPGAAGRASRGRRRDRLRARSSPSSRSAGVHAFYGNFGMLVRAYTYIRMHGADGAAPGQRERGAQRQLPPRQAHATDYDLP